ncbi:MAG TPA: nickel pincer cofactor biosynthesis protein LarC [Candidatus Eisenbacteria bacterium]|nr:nickel pincer cofactor biosynthesis protein LarC [Candidatus Eisenbacteria bacterium]
MIVAYFDCFSGASGDMLLGALVDAGWAQAELESLPQKLGLSGVTVSVGRARRGAIEAARVSVDVGQAQPTRHLHQVRERVMAADVPERAKTRAMSAFERLAEAEAKVHGTTVDKIHFHEVGAVDALIDFVGTCWGLESLGVEEVYASALPLGRGRVQTEHGVLPVPAPATAELLRGVPVEMPDVQAELVTPTGAALLTTLVRRWGWAPAFRVRAQGVGAGGRDLAEQPNVLRLFVGDTSEGAEPGLGRRTVMVLETALDDASPQVIATLVPGLLAAGARDAFLTAIQMKKGRPGILVTCLCDPGQEDALAGLLFRESPTLGVRVRREERIELARRAVEIDTPHGRVAAKEALLPDGTRRLMPEYESLAALAEKTGIPLLELSRSVLAAWNGGH